MSRARIKWALWLAVIPAVLSMGLPGVAQEAAPSLVASGSPPDLFLLYTGDVIGFIEPCG